MYRRSIVGLCALLALDCTDPVSPDHGLSFARQKWAQRGVSSYDITISRYCECIGGAPVMVSVRNGVVESRTYVGTGAPVSPSLAAIFPDVEGLFDLIDGAIRDGVAVLSVRYDPAWGYPADIDIDRVARIADDEVNYEIRNLLRR